MTIQEDAVIAEKTRKFAALERGFLKCWYGSRRPSTKEELIDLFKESLHIAEQAFLVKQEITESFLGVSEVRISDPEVQSTLEKIRRDEPFYSISFYGDVVKLLKEMDATNKAAPSYDDDIGELIDTKWDKLFGDFHSWFSISNYYYAIMKIGPIISSFEVPSHLTGYFHEIRETFAFKQYRAATALCKALLEKSLYEKLKTRRPFSNPNTGTVPSIAKTDFRNRNTGTVTPIFNRKKEEPGLGLIRK